MHVCHNGVIFILLTENAEKAEKTCLKKRSEVCGVYDVALVFCKVIVLLVSLHRGGYYG